MLSRIILILVLTGLFACGDKKSTSNTEPVPGSFAFDVNFVKTYKEAVILGSPTSFSKVLVVGDYQGRVMTSTAGGDDGNSYGWVNYDLIKSNEVRQHMNAYGGEDRFWLGPEGGQFALFFKKGDPFDYEHWQTPAVIDSEPFALVSVDSAQVTFKRFALVANYQGTTFQMNILRQIRMLTHDEIEKEFGCSLQNAKAVAFQSLNTITNNDTEDWSKANGLPSIWILGMFKPSPETTIIIPHETTDDLTKVTDDYFGVIPADRIKKTDSLLLMKGDARFRGKVGVSPAIARNVAGSYDAKKHILTLVKFDLDKSGDYVNSKWEIQKEPFKGDVINSYNDGSLSDSSRKGRFYELESSSPAREIRKGEALTHRHITLHVEGDEETLNQLARKVLGVELKKIRFGQ